MKETVLYANNVYCNDYDGVQGFHNIIIGVLTATSFNDSELNLLREYCLFIIDVNKIKNEQAKQKFLSRKEVKELESKILNLYFKIA